MNSKQLLHYSFLWNEARLVIAALSLIFGATPLLYTLFSYSASGLLTLGSVISGLTGAYLLYMWFQHDKKLFGQSDTLDLVAFMIAALSGIHLGLGGLLGTNFIMATLSPLGFLLTIAIYGGGLLYLWSAWHLHVRYKENGGKLF